jgi:predicted metalloprotease with PDZ domain
LLLNDPVMRYVICLFALTLVCLLSTAQPRPLHYSFSYDTTAAGPALVVKLGFRGDASGRTELMLPDSWASATELYKAVHNLSPLSKGTTIDTTTGAAHPVVVHRPGAHVLLSYRLVQDWTGSFNYPVNFRAAIQDRWMQATGYSLLVKPNWTKNDTVDLRMSWKDMPQRWTIANSLHTDSRSYKGKVSVGDLENSFFLAGDFRLHKVSFQNRPVYFAIRGTWSFSDTALVNQTLLILATERNFWKDAGESTYLVGLAPFEGTQSRNGTCMYQSFILGMSPDTRPDLGLQALLAHEYFHRWVGGLLQLSGPENEQTWFSEGFTEYYSYKILYRAGLINASEWASQLNAMIRKYYLSPYHHQPLSFLQNHYWDNNDSQRLPYNKGAVFAAWLDASLSKKEEGRSLDNLMLRLAEIRRGGTVLSDSVVVAEAAKLGATGVAALFQSSIIEGKTVPVMGLSNFPEYPVVVDTLFPFNLGFDRASLKKGASITGVEEGSFAWTAGLRNGMLLQGWSMAFDDVSKPVTLKVGKPGGSLREISYYPKSAAGIEVPQLIYRGK